MSKHNSDSLLDIHSSSSTLKSDVSDPIAQPVKLNVYGLAELNEELRQHKVGVYHVGVVVHDMEWSYGHHSYQISGIYSYKPHDVKALSKDVNLLKFVDTVQMGNTFISLNQITKYLTELGRTDWSGLKYHVVFKNSVNFASKFCRYLCDKSIPSWINCFPIINYRYKSYVALIPSEFKTPLALKELVEKKLEHANKYHEDISNIKLQKLIQILEQTSTANMIKTKDRNDLSKNAELKKVNLKEMLSDLHSNSETVQFIDSRIFAAPSRETTRKDIEEIYKDNNLQ